MVLSSGAGSAGHGVPEAGSNRQFPALAGQLGSRSALTLRAKVPNPDAEFCARMAADAQTNCPVSKLLKAKISLDAKLV